MLQLLKLITPQIIFIITICLNINDTAAEKLFKDLPEEPAKPIEKKAISTPTKTIEKIRPIKKKNRTKKPSTVNWFIDSKERFWQFNSKSKKWQQKPLLKDM